MKRATESENGIKFAKKKTVFFFSVMKSDFVIKSSISCTPVPVLIIHITKSGQTRCHRRESLLSPTAKVTLAQHMLFPSSASALGWPRNKAPHSPDLTPYNFRLWGRLKDKSIYNIVE